jgi:hypothetical protein
VQGIGVGAWSSGANMVSAQTNGSSLGSNPSADGLAAGGGTTTTWSDAVATTQVWNGSGWSSGSGMNTTRNGVRGNGTSTSALAIGGIAPPAADYKNETESWNGTSWSAETNYPKDINQTASAGTETATVAFGGYDYVSAPSTGGRAQDTNEYNGTSWTSSNNKNFGASALAGVGSQTAALGFGGFGQPGTGGPPGAPVSSPLTSSEEYDGTSWTITNSLNTARYSLFGAGDTSDAGAIGGVAPPLRVNNFEQWDGTSWTNSSTIATARSDLYGGGAPLNPTGTFIGGGSTDSPTISSTEVFNFGTTTVTPAAWSSGGNLNTARRSLIGAGTQTAALAAGGFITVGSSASEEYNGSTWTNTNSLNTARGGLQGGIGTTSASLIAGGSPPVTGATEEFNGTNWSTQPNSLSTARRYTAGFGLQTAAIICGGRTSPGTIITATEEYDGTSWTAGGDMGTPREQMGGTGTQTAGLTMGGAPLPIVNVEYYNGTSWSEQNNLPEQKASMAIMGTQTNALIAGGRTGGGSYISTTLGWDGSSFSTRPSLATARDNMGNTGPSSTSTSNAVFGGISPPGNTNATEEFTGETSAATASTLTTS